MIVLDTDHMVVLKYSQGSEYSTLTANMAASLDQHFVTTAITLEEQMRGWLALIHRSKVVHRQVSAYVKLNDLVDYFSRWERLPFNAAAADQFQDLRHQKVRIGTMDLKIAATALGAIPFCAATASSDVGFARRRRSIILRSFRFSISASSRKEAMVWETCVWKGQMLRR